MTAPDHRPYLREGDLRTAEDVLAWLIAYPGTDAAQASIDLDARIDRERRQACKRAVRDIMKNHLTLKRSLRHCAVKAIDWERNNRWDIDWRRERDRLASMRRHDVERALRWRAAARTP